MRSIAPVTNTYALTIQTEQTTKASVDAGKVARHLTAATVFLLTASAAQAQTPGALGDLNAALGTKVDTSNGTLTTPTVVGTMTGAASTRFDLGDSTAAFWNRFGLPALRVSTRGGTNAIVGMADNNLAASANSFPTGVTGMGRISAGNLGNAGYGFYGECHSFGTGVCNGAEIDTFNWLANPTDISLPPNRAIGISQALPVTLTLGAAGNYSSFLALQLVRGGANPQGYLNGIYTNPDAITGNGLFVDATASVGPAAPVTIAAKPGATNLSLIARGSFSPSQPMLSGQDSSGVQRVAVTQGGSALLGPGTNDRGTGAAECISGGLVVNTGDSQTCRRLLRIGTSGATSGVLTVGAAAASATTQVPIGYSGYLGLRVTATVSARNQANGHVASWDCRAVLSARSNTAASVAVVGTPSCVSVAADSDMSAAGVALSADTTNGTLAITGTGFANAPILWTARVDSEDF